MLAVLERWYIFLCFFVALFAASVASAESADPFAELEKKENAIATEEAINSGNPVPEHDDPYSGANSANSWDDLDKQPEDMSEDEASRLYEDSYEYRINKEVNKKLPERSPFGDQLGEIEEQLKVKK